MARVLDRLLDQYDRGRLNRRELLRALAVATGGALAGASGTTDVEAQGTGLAPAQTLNHVHVGVKDVKKSTEFYAAVLGAKPKGNSPTSQMMVLPGAKPGDGLWISLSDASGPKREYGDRSGDKAGVYSHVGYGVDVLPSEFPRIAEEIKKRFPDVRPPNLFKTDIAGQEIIIFDPDDTPLQLIQRDFNG